MEHIVSMEWYSWTLHFTTHENLFAPRGADRGSLAMLRSVDWQEGEKVLDLGCGYGLVGICAAVTPKVAKVVLIDNDPLAVEFARRNVLQLLEMGKGIPEVLWGDGPAAAKTGFTLILSNPPYHTDFAVAKRFIEQGFACLELGGRMVMVVKRLAWYQNKMSAIFGGVRVSEQDSYFILTSEKRTAQPQNTSRSMPPGRSMPPKTTKKHRKKMMAKRNDAGASRK